MRYLNLDKAVLYPRNKVICMKNWKLWQGLSTLEVFFLNLCTRSLLNNKVICMKNWKLWQALSTLEVFFLNLCTRSLLNNIYKSMFGIFLFCLDLVSCDVSFCESLETRSFLIFANNSRSKQNKKQTFL